MKREGITQDDKLGVRFRLIRAQYFGNSNRKFAQAIGIDEANLSSICGGKKNAGEDIKERVIKACPGLSRAWLYFGEGEMKGSEGSVSAGNTETRPSAREDELIRMYEQRLAERDKTISELMTGYKELTEHVRSLMEMNMRLVQQQIVANKGESLPIVPTSDFKPNVEEQHDMAAEDSSQIYAAGPHKN